MFLLGFLFWCYCQTVDHRYLPSYQEGVFLSNDFKTEGSLEMLVLLFECAIVSVFVPNAPCGQTRKQEVEALQLHLCGSKCMQKGMWWCCGLNRRNLCVLQGQKTSSRKIESTQWSELPLLCPSSRQPSGLKACKCE